MIKSEVDESMDILTLYANLEWGDMWEEALARDLIKYLRSSKMLVIPDQWRSVLPTALPAREAEGAFGLVGGCGSEKLSLRFSGVGLRV